MDFILRNVKLIRENKDYIIDVGINYEEVNYNNARDFYLKASIEDVGDLSVYYGYEEVDLSEYFIESGKTKPESYSSIEELEKINPIELYSQGFTNVILKDGDFSGTHSNLPFNIILNEEEKLESFIKPDDQANFIIKKNTEIRFAVINGHLINIEKIDEWVGNSIIYSK